MDLIVSTAFVANLVTIIGINLVLAGDNAVVIALAARSLPVRLQRQAILYGTILAVVLRIVLTAGIAALLTVPLLKVVGGVLLLWIGYRLASSADDDHDITPADGLRQAVMTILVADLVMSLDNVLAVAAAANGDYLLIVLGLAISIPIVMGGAAVLLTLVKRYPAIVWAGAGLIIYTGLELIVDDPYVHRMEWVAATPGWGVRVIGLSLTIALLGVTLLLARRGERAQVASVRGEVAGTSSLD